MEMEMEMEMGGYEGEEEEADCGGLSRPIAGKGR